MAKREALIPQSDAARLFKAARAAGYARARPIRHPDGRIEVVGEDTQDIATAPEMSLSRNRRLTMRAKLHGINPVRRILASGKVKMYYYHRAIGTRLQGEPDTPEFLAFIAADEMNSRNRSQGTLSGVIREFEATAKWRKLAESTRSEYRRVMTFGKTSTACVRMPPLKTRRSAAMCSNGMTTIRRIILGKPTTV